jgi:N6-L-threonylcarbamoyladenine synthase
VIEKTAGLSENPEGIKFPKSFSGKDSLDFSFSGLKTAVLYMAEKARNTKSGIRDMDKGLTRDICYAFQEAALDILVEKTCLAVNKTGVRSVVVGGGVAANSRLRQKLTASLEAMGVMTYFPAFRYCLDNAAMIASLGEKLYRRGVRSDLYMSAEPNLLLK